MGLTRLDCSVFRGPEAPEQSSSFVAFNPTSSPLSLAFAAASASSHGIGAQVASRLALDRFTEAVLNGGSKTDIFTPTATLENAFRETNSGVYSFAHQLAAGGRMAATLFAVVLEYDQVAVARVGKGSAYLFRQGQLFPFFDDETGRSRSGREEWIGRHPIVDVEISSAPIEGNDFLCIFDRSLESYQETALIEVLEHFDFEPQGAQVTELASVACQTLFNEIDAITFSLVAHIGPETVYLSKPVEEDLAFDERTYDISGKAHSS